MDERTFITKVKVNADADHVEVEYTKDRSGVTEAYTLVVTGEKAAPAPTLLDALRDLIDIGLDILKLPPEYRAGIRVSGASFTDNDKQGFGGTFTLVKSLDKVNGPLVLNVPHHSVGSPDDKAPSKFTDEQATAMRKLQIEAGKYLRGHRAQESLFNATRAAANDLPEADFEEGDTSFRRGKAIAEAPKKEKAKKPGKGRKVKSKDDEGDGDA